MPQGAGYAAQTPGGFQESPPQAADGGMVPYGTGYLVGA
jgi:hypothetical protein